jgi:hypothetical protein
VDYFGGSGREECQAAVPEERQAYSGRGQLSATKKSYWLLASTTRQTPRPRRDPGGQRSPQLGSD